MCLPSGHKTPSQGSCVRRRPQASHSGWGKFCSTQWRDCRKGVKHCKFAWFQLWCPHPPRPKADCVGSCRIADISLLLSLSPGTFPHAFRKVGRAAVRIYLVLPVLEIQFRFEIKCGITLKQSCQLAVHNSWRLQIQCASMYCHFLKVPDTRKWPLVRPQSCQPAVGSGWPIIFPTSLGRFF